MKSRDAVRMPHHKEPIKLLTVGELSHYLHVHPTTIYRLLRSNQIPAFRVGSNWRFNLEAIDHWCLQQEKLP
jgi:excisionase family DNA binding protein